MKASSIQEMATYDAKRAIVLKSSKSLVIKGGPFGLRQELNIEWDAAIISSSSEEGHRA